MSSPISCKLFYRGRSSTDIVGCTIEAIVKKAGEGVLKAALKLLGSCDSCREGIVNGYKERGGKRGPSSPASSQLKINQ